MLKMGLDIGTGFVKCVSDYGRVRFPSIYVKRTHGSWTGRVSEAVGNEAMQMLDTMGAAAIRPITRGRPDPRYQKQVELLVAESLRQIRKSSKSPIGPDEKIRIVVGLPYYASDQKDAVTRMVRKTLNAEKCTVVAQASGTLVDLDKSSGMVVSIGQGTTEIIVIDDYEVIDGDSSRWASDFVTRKLGKFAHLDTAGMGQNVDTCRRYSRILATNIVREVCDTAETYGNRYPIALSGGGLLIPGLHDELLGGLKGFKVLIPDDPVMSNAVGLYKMAGEL